MSRPIHSVNVLAIDEEKLKFRVMISIEGNVQPAANGKFGRYRVNLPPPTAIANSDKYNSCEIKLENFVAFAPSGVGAPTWVGPAVDIKCPALIVRMNVGSSQTTQIRSGQNMGAVGQNVGDTRMGGFATMIGLRAEEVGDNAGAFGTGRSKAWMGNDVGDGIKCANPFGREIELTLNEPQENNLCYIAAAAGGGGGVAAEEGLYSWQFLITMIPNK